MGCAASSEMVSVLSHRAKPLREGSHVLTSVTCHVEPGVVCYGGNYGSVSCLSALYLTVEFSWGEVVRQDLPFLRD